ncbi:MAG TPA: hypothetical protein VJ486_11590 [Geothrix sp.]|nr:hypothetical protein [Geothrix sp.]
MRSLYFSAALALSLGSMGCLRSYNATPLTTASLQGSVATPDGVELKTKAFLTPAEVSEKFGTKLAEDRQVIPVQVLLTNKSTSTYRVLRTSFIMEELGQKVRLEALDSNQMYELGRHGYGAPVCGLIFGGILGVPSLITTMNANDRLREDYNRKGFLDTILEPTKEAAGVVMFDPAARTLTRSGKYKLIVELENTTSKSKTVVEQLFN